MSDIEKHLRWLRDVSGRTNLEAAVAIEALQAEVATLNVMVTDWIEAFDKQKARAEAAEAEVDRLKGDKDEAYAERNKLVAFLARCFPSGTMKTDIPGWDPEWHGCVFIDTPQGQMSWHYHDREAHLFENLPPYKGEWDGHTTPEKYARLAALEAKP